MQGRVRIGDRVWLDSDRGICEPVHQRALGYVFQEASLFPHLSVRANLLYGYRRTVGRGLPETIRVDEVVELLGIGPLLARSVLRLSGGERQRVAIGRVLLAQPRLLLMDEPTAGMAPKERVALMELAARLARARQIAVLFTEHDMDVVFSQADRIVVLDRGRLIAGGLPAEVRANPNVREVYLGSMH